MSARPQRHPRGLGPATPGSHINIGWRGESASIGAETRPGTMSRSEASSLELLRSETNASQRAFAILRAKAFSLSHLHGDLRH